MKNVKAILGLGLLVVPFAAGANTNLITNGDFESGNTGFTSDYTYVSPGYNVMYPEGLYTIDTNPNNDHNLWYSFGDHTTGHGNMMIVNGHPDDNKTVWGQSVSVNTNTNYDFSFWVASSYPTSLATLKVTVNGVELAGSPVTAPSTAGQWMQFDTNWNSNGSSLANIAIVDTNTQRSGNDFALDDIRMQSVPEPTSLAAIGVGIVGLIRRRAKKA